MAEIQAADVAVLSSANEIPSDLNASAADIDLWVEALTSAGWPRQAAEAVIDLNQDTLFVNFAIDETLGRQALYSGPHVQDSFPPSLSWPAFFNRSGVALPQV